MAERTPDHSTPQIGVWILAQVTSNFGSGHRGVFWQSLQNTAYAINKPDFWERSVGITQQGDDVFHTLYVEIRSTYRRKCTHRDSEMLRMLSFVSHEHGYAVKQGSITTSPITHKSQYLLSPLHALVLVAEVIRESAEHELEAVHLAQAFECGASRVTPTSIFVKDGLHQLLLKLLFDGFGWWIFNRLPSDAIAGYVPRTLQPLAKCDPELVVLSVRSQAKLVTQRLSPTLGVMIAEILREWKVCCRSDHNGPNRSHRGP